MQLICFTKNKLLKGASIMSRAESEQQQKDMANFFKGKGVFKPLNTGFIDEKVGCIREYVANIFFYTKNGTTIMIDAGYNYPRLKEKMEWLGINPLDIQHILITHQDTDHVGAVEQDSDQMFNHAQLYMGEIEYRYIKGEKKRKVYYGFYKLPQVIIDNPIKLIKDGDIFYINDIKIEAILVAGHTWGHLVYLIDDTYLFTGDTIWFGADGGYSFLNVLAEDNKLSRKSLLSLKNKMLSRNLRPLVITGHTGWSDEFDRIFSHVDRSCNAWVKQKPVDVNAPYDAYDETDDTPQKAKTERLKKQQFIG